MRTGQCILICLHLPQKSKSHSISRDMNSRPLAALLSSLISQVIILLFLLFPASDTLTFTDSFSFPGRDFQEIIFPLLHHFLVKADIAAILSFSSFSRKRKRANFQNPDASGCDHDGDAGFRLDRFHPFDTVISRSPESFKQLFGMKVSTFEWLCGLLEPLLDCRDPVESPLNLPAETRLGIGIFRLATGADYHEISDRFRVSEAASKFCVKQLCRVLCTNFRFWVGFPSHTELDSVSTQFEGLTGLSNCCGIICCTRFPIERAGSSDSILKNVAQQESIAVQIVVDSSSRILSIIAGFHGKKSDMLILKSSTLFKDIEKGLILNSPTPAHVNGVSIPQYLVGNGEYPLLPWLLVPFVDPEAGSVEENFNNVHQSMCDSSLKVVASLRKWGVLSRTIKEEYEFAVAYIGSCSILHNMLMAREDRSTFVDELNDRELNVQNRGSTGASLTVEKALVIRSALATRAKK